jgi:hypothetical protein
LLVHSGSDMSALSLYVRENQSSVVFASDLPVGASGTLGAVSLSDDGAVVSLIGSAEGGAVGVWANTVAAGVATFVRMPFANMSAGGPAPVLLPRGAHALVDLDGDCRADLALAACAVPLGPDGSCEQPVLSVWSRDPVAVPALYRHALDLPLPAGCSAPMFADFTGNGAIDVAVACAGTDEVVVFGSGLAVPADATCADSPVAVSFPPARRARTHVPVSAVPNPSLAAGCRLTRAGSAGGGAGSGGLRPRRVPGHAGGHGGRAAAAAVARL